MKTLTIITPTYNRAQFILNLYTSLENQTNKDFCWLVVDDGSIDNTDTIIERLKNSASFEILYLKKSNGGKHTALNYGINKIASELTMIVDSDDSLTSDAVQAIVDVHKKYSYYKNISCYSFLRGNKDGKALVPIGKKEFVDNYITYRIKGNRPGDMAEVYKTIFLKEYPFPEYENEKFISEDVVWIEIGKNSDTLYIDKVIYICEYLNGGLTDNDKKMKFESPLGSMLRGKKLMSKECGLKENLKGGIIYNVYAFEAKKKGIENVVSLSFREKVLARCTSSVAYYFYQKWHKGIVV